ncbi:MAG: hypothetical protein QOI63_1262 [Thermoplasmata archaeon]|jgi:hypothetical protein|nr:hypothetical protein [Thermoplasmata archaeon]
MDLGAAGVMAAAVLLLPFSKHLATLVEALLRRRWDL